MILTLRWQTTKISSALKPRYSAKLRSPLMLMLGFAPLNPSLLFLQFHVRTPIRLTLLPNNFVVLPVFGGIIIVPCNRMAMLSPGKSFGMLSGHTIYQRTDGAKIE
jgi:hypothetical protein